MQVTSLPLNLRSRPKWTRPKCTFSWQTALLHAVSLLIYSFSISFSQTAHGRSPTFENLKPRITLAAMAPTLGPVMRLNPALERCGEEIEKRGGFNPNLQSNDRTNVLLNRGLITAVQSLMEFVPGLQNAPYRISFSRQIEFPFEAKLENPNAVALLRLVEAVESRCSSTSVSDDSQPICQLPHLIDILSQWRPTLVHRQQDFLHFTLNGIFMTSALNSVISGDSVQIADELSKWINLANQLNRTVEMIFLGDEALVCDGRGHLIEKPYSEFAFIIHRLESQHPRIASHLLETTPWLRSPSLWSFFRSLALMPSQSSASQWAQKTMNAAIKKLIKSPRARDILYGTQHARELPGWFPIQELRNQIIKSSAPMKAPELERLLLQINRSLSHQGNVQDLILIVDAAVSTREVFPHLLDENRKSIPAHLSPWVNIRPTKRSEKTVLYEPAEVRALVQSFEESLQRVQEAFFPE